MVVALFLYLLFNIQKTTKTSRFLGVGKASASKSPKTSRFWGVGKASASKSPKTSRFWVVAAGLFLFVQTSDYSIMGR
jgi:hypothetical protein